MKVGIATDHGGFGLKEELVAQLRAAGHDVVDFGAHKLKSDDDYPDNVTPLAKAVASCEVKRSIAICGSGVEDDHTNILCMGGRRVGPAVAWDLVQTFLAAEYGHAERHLRRLGKMATLENAK